MKLAQFRFIDTNSSIPDTSKIEAWSSGDAFKINSSISTGYELDVFPAYRIRIQTYPGVKFNINNSLDWVTVGYDGVYELDLGTTNPLITGVKFAKNSLESVITMTQQTGLTKEGILLEVFFEGRYS